MKDFGRRQFSLRPAVRLGRAWLLGGAFVVATCCVPAGLQAMQGQTPAAAADLILRGGTVLTMDAGLPVAEALAVRDGRVVAVGSNAEVDQLGGPNTRRVELGGRAVTPGLIEGHGHFVSLGTTKMQLDLMDATSWEEVVRRVAAAARTTPAGRWIVGRGWHQSKWEPAPEPNVEGYPLHTALSEATPEHPVLLTHASGHMCLANRKAMALAGVDRNTRDVAGGEILRDAEGEPIGVFRENASALVEQVYARAQRQRTPEQQQQDWLTAVELAGQECLRYGITSFHDAGVSFDTAVAFRQLAESRRLPVRLYVMINEGNASLARQLPAHRWVGEGDGFLTVRAIKRIFDGALGTHGAWLIEPYDDLGGSTGLNTISVESLRQTARLARQHGFQLCVHAIGDMANREALNVIRDTWQDAGEKPDHRWRIEHAQHLDPEDIPRFAELGVVASMQGIHCTSDAAFVVQRLGMRRAQQGAYVWRSLLDSGATIVNGTDAPVERVDPLASYRASVTRRLANGVEFFPEQCMTREEALASYTRSSAWAAFEEESKGSLAPGKLADLVVLSDNPLTCSDERLAQMRVEMTVLAGEIVFQAD